MFDGKLQEKNPKFIRLKINSALGENIVMQKNKYFVGV